MTDVCMTSAESDCESFSYDSSVFPVPRVGELVLFTKNIFDWYDHRKSYFVEIELVVVSVLYDFKAKRIIVECKR